MKALYILISFFTICLITSCGSSEREITGTYDILQWSSVNCDDPDNNVMFDFSQNDGCDVSLNVCGDGTVIINESTFTLDLTISFGGGFNQNVSASGGYTFDGETIIICDSAGDNCISNEVPNNEGDLSLRFIDNSSGCTLSLFARQ